MDFFRLNIALEIGGLGFIEKYGKFPKSMMSTFTSMLGVRSLAKQDDGWKEYCPKNTRLNVSYAQNGIWSVFIPYINPLRNGLTNRWEQSL